MEGPATDREDGAQRVPWRGELIGLSSAIVRGMLQWPFIDRSKALLAPQPFLLLEEVLVVAR